MQQDFLNKVLAALFLGEKIMTQNEFDKYLDALVDFTDEQYALEVWESMTKAEKEKCSREDMEAYIQDTYFSVTENY